jgi:hypothetical protein
LFFNKSRFPSRFRAAYFIRWGLLAGLSLSQEGSFRHKSPGLCPRKIRAHTLTFALHRYPAIAPILRQEKTRRENLNRGMDQDAPELTGEYNGSVGMMRLT